MDTTNTNGKGTMIRLNLRINGIKFRRGIVAGRYYGIIGAKQVTLQNFGNGAYPWRIREFTMHGGESMVLGRGRTAREAITEAQQ